jgi:uncharacterized protein YbaP (TraB family)
MKKACLTAAFIFFSIFSSFAQAPKSSLLWEIGGNGLAHPSYIFGTFHIMCKGDFTVSGVLENKIKDSQQFYGEIDLDQPNLQADMMAKMMMHDKTLQSLLGDDYQQTSEKFQAITGTPMLMLNSFKPFLCLSLLAVNSTQCKETVQPETEFIKVAKQNHLSIHGLETMNDELNAIDKEPIDSQINELKKIVSNFDSVKTMMSQLVVVYKQRNTDSLYAFMKSTGASEDFETELLDKRNKKWIPVIQGAIMEKPTFFAVGAAHLGGPDGVLSLLRKQGYRLTPVTY